MGMDGNKKVIPAHLLCNLTQGRGHMITRSKPSTVGDAKLHFVRVVGRACILLLRPTRIEHSVFNTSWQPTAHDSQNYSKLTSLIEDHCPSAYMYLLCVYLLCMPGPVCNSGSRSLCILLLLLLLLLSVVWINHKTVAISRASSCIRNPRILFSDEYVGLRIVTFSYFSTRSCSGSACKSTAFFCY